MSINYPTVLVWSGWTVRRSKPYNNSFYFFFFSFNGTTARFGSRSFQYFTSRYLYHCRSPTSNRFFTSPRYLNRLWSPPSLLFNPLNPELNPICYLLALLAHHFLHVSRIRVKSLTFRRLMSYIYIYIWSTHS